MYIWKIVIETGENKEKCKKFTNNIENVTEDRSCFSALLTPQGKYLYDFIIIKH